MRHQRHSMALGVLFLALAACGSHANVSGRANRALATALASVNATQTAFVSWDAEEQARIVAAATTENDGHVALLSYRARRAKVTQAFVAAYAVMAVAAGSIVLFEGGGDAVDLAKHLRDVGASVLELQAAIAAMRGQ